MEIGLVQKIDIDREMQQAYLDYAMSVIVARALPDARDGLKPVHRRILYAMYDMGLRPDSPYKKSARIVGEVLGKYHPHGDAAVYEAMARMAQDFSMRYLLVEGQGNFGSVDGDPPAAMRYTEARLASPATHMLADIQKNTVDFGRNFDDTLIEPSVLPAAVPNLLVNGATGIAVGMATSIPPHNLSEIVAAMQHVLEHWDSLDDVSVEDLMRFVKGPDFPTGGVLVHTAGSDGLESAYGTGRGQVTIQARAHLEEMERGRSRIIVTELPYMTNKASLIERIAELAREGKLEGIADLRDESDRQGMRIVIELSKTADSETMLAQLYKHTPMQSTFSINMLALVDGEPRTLSLKQALRVYLDHRLEVVRRRSQYDLDRARQRAHILEGLRVALKNLDEVIEIIRKAADVDTARLKLMKRFKLSEIQAQAILDMQLRRLAALERKKIEEEYKELQATIKDLEALLRSPKRMRQTVSDELNAVSEAYGDRRRTHIVLLKEGQARTALVSAGELVPEKEVWLSVTPGGLISRSIENRQPRLSGADAPAWLVRVNTRDTLYLVGESGEAAALPVHAIPEGDDPGQGSPYDRVTPLKDGRKLAAVFSVPPRSRREDVAKEGDNIYVVTVTRGGMIKKSDLSELPGASAGLFNIAKVNEGDLLLWAGLSSGSDELLLATAHGMAIRFSEDDVRPMGLVAAGVLGIRLGAGDQLVGAALLPVPGTKPSVAKKAAAHEWQALLITTSGRAKRLELNQFPLQGRYGLGVQAWKLAPREEIVGLGLGKPGRSAILHLEKHTPKAVQLEDAPLQSRATRGTGLGEIKPGDAVTRLTVPFISTLPGTIPEDDEPEAPSRRKPTPKSPSPTTRGTTVVKSVSKAIKRAVKSSLEMGIEPDTKSSANATPKSTLRRTRKSTDVQLELPVIKSDIKSVSKAPVKPADTSVISQGVISGSKDKTTSNLKVPSKTIESAKSGGEIPPKPGTKAAPKTKAQPGEKIITKASAKPISGAPAKTATEQVSKTRGKVAATPGLQPPSEASQKAEIIQAVKAVTRPAAKAEPGIAAKSAAKVKTKPAQTAVSKITAKPDEKTKSRLAMETVPTEKPAGKGKTKPATTISPKAAAKPTRKVETKPVAATASKTEVKVAAKTKTKTASAPKLDTKPAGKADSRSVTKTASKTDKVKPAAKTKTGPATKTTVNKMTTTTTKTTASAKAQASTITKALPVAKKKPAVPKPAVPKPAVPKPAVPKPAVPKPAAPKPKTGTS